MAEVDSQSDTERGANLSRREFVKVLGTGALAAGALPLVGAAKAVASAGPTPSAPAETAVARFYKTLKDEQRKVFFTKFEERLNEEVSHPLFGYKATYRRCIELQGRLLAKCVTGEIEEYPPFLVH